MEIFSNFRIMIDPRSETPKNIFVTDRVFVRAHPHHQNTLGTR